MCQKKVQMCVVAFFKVVVYFFLFLQEISENAFGGYGIASIPESPGHLLFVQRRRSWMPNVKLPRLSRSRAVSESEASAVEKGLHPSSVLKQPHQPQIPRIVVESERQQDCDNNEYNTETILK